MEGGTQEFLLRMRDSELKDEELLDEFYQKIMDNYIFPEKLLHHSDSRCLRCAGTCFEQSGYG